LSSDRQLALEGTHRRASHYLRGDRKNRTSVVKNSALDWTIVRAAVLTNKAATGRINYSNADKTTRIGRADVAAALSDQLTRDTFSRQAISITS
jgi:hypothetical protein